MMLPLSSRIMRLRQYLPTALASASPVMTRLNPVSYLQRAHYQRRYSLPYRKSRININERLDTLALFEDKVTHPIDHPKVMIREVEQVLIRKLLDIQTAKTRITLSMVIELYSGIIEKYSNEELSPQMLTDIATSFLTNYDLEWLRTDVIPLVPVATAKLGRYSDIVRICCIMAYGDENTLSKPIDKMVCKIYKELGTEPEMSSVIHYSYIINEMFKTWCKTSR